MDEAERVSIDIGYEASVADALAQPADARTTVREDGSLVIDILVAQPCAAEPSTGDEIVVCAAAESMAAPPVAAPPPSPTAMEKVGNALNVTVGPVELGSIPNRDGTRTFGARIRF